MPNKNADLGGMKAETPQEAYDRMRAMSAAEREGVEKATEGQLVARPGEQLNEEALQAREDRLNRGLGRPIGNQSYTDMDGEALDREAQLLGRQDVPNRPVLTDPKQVTDLNEQNRQAARGIQDEQRAAAGGKAGSDEDSRSSGSSSKSGSKR